ncbi:OmpA family protein [Pseudonocardia sp. TRM90224]|uniref:OmpA family protein n=1 Tax=Pseudonocardia sp. TRM90224 TaxID=2812678 RepID=UPI00272E9B1D|nr:OmpA family protein [Pseudonocardia sp. TRM90224]
MYGRTGRGRGRVIGAAAALLVLVLPACGRTEQGIASAASESAPAATAALPAGPAPVAGNGVVAEPIATTLPVRGDNLRLVRTGADLLAFQFEFVNTGEKPVEPDWVGLDGYTHVIVQLIDLPRGTGYVSALSAEILPWNEFSLNPGLPMISKSAQDSIAPGASATVTVVFHAPPPETTSMLVSMDGFLPVEVPVLPQGSSELRDDPILHVQAQPEDDRRGPVLCAVASAPEATTTESQFRLPADIAFEFGSAALSESVGPALDGLKKQVTAASGTVVVEGHTDSIGTDAANQTLSEQRAAAVRSALEARLGTGFQFTSTGLGESRPIASNTKPDGSDDPNGRAQNRRVEVTITTTKATTATTAAPALDPSVNTVALAKAGLVPKLRSVRALAGFALAQVEITNTGTLDIPLGYLADNHIAFPDDVVADTGGEMSLSDGKGALHNTCELVESWINLVAPSFPSFVPLGGDKLPAGATAVMWALFANPPGDQAVVTIKVGGFADSFSATVGR